MLIVIPADHAKEAWQFAELFEAERSKTRGNFGRSDKQRNSAQILSNNATGKVAELAVCQWLSSRGVDAAPDMVIRNKAEDYGQDIHITKGYLVPRIDVKATKSLNFWLLVEKYKFYASAYVPVLLNLPNNPDKSAFSKEIKATIKGFAYWRDFFDKDMKPWFQYKKGNALFTHRFTDRIVQMAKAQSPYGNLTHSTQLHKVAPLVRKKWPEKDTTGYKMDCECQYGLPLSWLRTDFDSLADIIKSSLTTKPLAIFTPSKN